MKVIFISGLHRSGTTILNRILGAHSECVAVGEVDNVISYEQDRKWVEEHYSNCTCGNCNFWPEVMKKIDENTSKKLDERYAVFLKVFNEFFPGKIPIDSSKRLTSLVALQKVSEVKIIYMIRDVRGWSTSSKGRVTLRGMLGWYRLNKRMEQSLPGAYQLGYEPLMFDIENQMKSLCKELDLTYEHNILTLNSMDEHILVGNRMRTNKVREIKYDYKWMKDISIWPSVMVPIMKYNQVKVYKNI